MKQETKKIGFIIFFFIFFLLLGKEGLLAQHKHKNTLRPIRMEVASGNTDNFHLIPMGKYGLLIFYETSEINQKGKRLWYFALFDTLLRQKWLRPVPLTNHLYYINQKQQNTTVCMVFRNTNKVKKNAGFYDILIYNMKKQFFRSVQGSLPAKSDISSFAFNGQKLVFGINLKDKKADALFVDTRTGEIRVNHIDLPKEPYVDGVFRNTTNNTFVLVAGSTDTKSNPSEVIYVFQADGSPLQQIPISYFSPMSRLGDFELASASDNHLKFFGIEYLMTKGGFLQKGNTDDLPQAEGFFYLNIKNGKQNTIRHFNFLDFKNIQGTYMQSEHIRNKNSKETLSLLTVTHPVVQQIKDGFLVSVNAYTPYYKTESHMDYDFYGNLYPTDYRVFAGYQFYDVIIAGFSSDGRFLWDNDFSLNNILSYRINNKALIYPDSSQVTLAYVAEGKIITQDIYKNKKLDAPEEVPIVSRYKRDHPVGTGESKIIHWYGHYFLTYGYQQLKNRALQNQPLRTVFYVNKVSLQ